MISPLQFIRLLQINSILIRHTFRRPVIGKHSNLLRWLSYLNPWSFMNSDQSRGESIRLALESLGPIFIKFGQVLSTRRDLLPEDIANELEKLQDRVPPFASLMVKEIIEQTYQKKIEEIFLTFNETPLASASIAQVHEATLKNGAKVVVKVLRPNIEKIIQHDIAILNFVAKLTKRFWIHGKRLQPVALVAEFKNTLIDEIDLIREAANASQLKRNFKNSTKMYVPQVYWDYVRSNILVLEQIHGVRISDIKTLRKSGTNMKKLAENGVEIFFTQVFRDNFFHADMHPGNLFVDISDVENPIYLGVDFGIMGALNPLDQHYLAQNLLAFFSRDYRQIAQLHVESGWIPSNTRVDQFEGAIRTVCEPVFEKPLQEISFAQLLLRLFTTAKRFNMEVQPQLMLLQKTLFNIEGLGRQLYPELDLWTTAKPFMEKWLRDQNSIKNLIKTAKTQWPGLGAKIIQSPNLIYTILKNVHVSQLKEKKHKDKFHTHHQKQQRRFFIFGVGLTLLMTAGINLIAPFIANANILTLMSSMGGVLLLIGWLSN